MTTYYINLHPLLSGGDVLYMVHAEACQYLPTPDSRIVLGRFESC